MDWSRSGMFDFWNTFWPSFMLAEHWTFSPGEAFGMSHAISTASTAFSSGCCIFTAGKIMPSAALLGWSKQRADRITPVHSALTAAKHRQRSWG